MAYRTLVAGFSYPVSDLDCRKAQKGEPHKRLDVPLAGTVIASLPPLAAKSGLAQKFIEEIAGAGDEA